MRPMKKVMPNAKRIDPNENGNIRTVPNAYTIHVTRAIAIAFENK